MEKRIGKSTLRLVQGDITQVDTEAIVNAANSSLMGGGGVDGAIHRAGGPAILTECKAIVTRQGRLPTGEAVITGGGSLKARYVIHTVGPVWRGGDRNERTLLANAYRNVMALVRDRSIRSVSFPSISTGAFGFPLAEASRIALNTLSTRLLEAEDSISVQFVLFSQADLAVYAKTLKECQNMGPGVGGREAAGGEGLH
ncbi:MAG: O-acetyl-ADP-ribose deacetylase [bacterium]|nr:O-acetyl-ADP-ribose deacetylase [bacterium]